MADTLLRELSNTDLDWMITRGDRHQLSPNQQLLSPKDTQPLIYVLIEGRLGLSYLSDYNSGHNSDHNSGYSTYDSLASVDFSFLNELNPGEIVGISTLFERPEIATVYALAPSMVLSISLDRVQKKVTEDLSFAAHFYRAIAIMLSNRMRQIFEHTNWVQFWETRSTKEVLSVFAEMRDSDIDWLASFGQVETISRDRVLLQAGRPVDALYILLEGQMAVSAPEGSFNPLCLCFSGLENSTRHQKSLTTLSKGSMPGVISFIDSQPLPVTVRASQGSLIFVVPRQKLSTKLQVDEGFAARFYRVMAIEILEMLQAIRTRQVSLIPADDEELELDDLHQMSEGAKKFNWMLSQLGVVPHA
jgi:bacteriocin-type transport-associated protein